MMLLMKGYAKNQRGFSLLEALLAIVIIVAAGLGVVELFISADKKNKAQATQTIVQQAASAMSQLLSTSYNSVGLTTVDVVNSGLISSTYVGPNATIVGPYGSITVTQGNTTAPSEYYVVAVNIPGDQALNICQSMFTSAAISATASAPTGSTFATSLTSCQSTFGGKSNIKQTMNFAFPREDFIENTTT